MKRKLTETLAEWKSSTDQRCLVIQGARQVGKTYTVRKFGEENYPNFIYCNFEMDRRLLSAFGDDLSVDTIVVNLSNILRVKFVPGETLLFLDEIQECPNARTSLKFFKEDGRYDVIASGSLLGIKRKEMRSYPVGSERRVTMYPMDFEEFLWADGIDGSMIRRVRDAVRGRTELDAASLEVMSSEFVRYMAVGGMPAAVSEFVSSGDIRRVDEIRRSILEGYSDDARKYAEQSDSGRIPACLRSLPFQLSKGSRAFKYADITGEEVEVGYRSKAYRGSTEWLIDSGIVQQCFALSGLEIPLRACVRPNVFKLYMNDHGLLISMYESQVSEQVLEWDRGMNKGAVTENAVASQIRSAGQDVLFYQRKSGLELDFILNVGGKTVAVEVKSGNNTKSKSLGTAMERYGLDRGVKLEDCNIHTDSRGVEHYPLFVCGFLDCL